jgi:hypothetical protein
MKSTVNNDQKGIFRLLFKPTGKDKGMVQGVNSKLMVEAPYETAINGGSPDFVLLDEIGQMGILGGILRQGRPTLFGIDPITKKYRRLRQIILWGTGGKHAN